MANAITVLKMTTANSSVAVVPTLAFVDSGTGAYIDCRHIDAAKMILVFKRHTSGTAIAASADDIKIVHGGDTAGYSAYGVGSLTIRAVETNASDAATGELACQFAGPFETARFKDSQGYINIVSTNMINIKAVGAILI